MRPAPQSHAFSLLELLAAIALVAVVLAFAIRGYNGMVQASALTTSADLLNDALNEARQNAVTQNTTVEVRIYALPSQPGMPPAYGSLQLHWVKPDKTTPAIGHPWLLPASTVIDATPDHSSLIAANTQEPAPDPSDPKLDARTRIFHFLPDGSTDLDPSARWFLTLRAATQSNPAHFPANWACVQIDPATGRGQIRRP